MNIDELWSVFLSKYEPDFKEYMKYGKEEIEKIGVKKFFDAMGWHSESQLTSYLTDALHITPCIDCSKEFGIIETDFGLCENCAKEYDLTEFEKYRGLVAAGEGRSYYSAITQLFMISPTFRKTFKNVPPNTPMYAMYAVDSGAPKDKWEWKPCPIEALKKLLAAPLNAKIVFKIMLKNGSPYEENGKSEFFAYSEVKWDKLLNEEG